VQLLDPRRRHGRAAIGEDPAGGERGAGARVEHHQPEHARNAHQVARRPAGEGVECGLHPEPRQQVDLAADHQHLRQLVEEPGVVEQGDEHERRGLGRGAEQAPVHGGAGGEGALGDHGPLRPARRAGREADEARGGGARLRRHRRGSRLPPDRVRRAALQTSPREGRGGLRDQLLAGAGVQRQPRIGDRQLPAELHRPEPDVQRDDDCAELQAREEREDPLDPVLRHQRDPVARRDAGACQPAPEVVGGRGQLGIGERVGGVAHRHPLGRGGRPGAERRGKCGGRRQSNYRPLG
jgi:hypothetical protein